jgi:hypothetical protein
MRRPDVSNHSTGILECDTAHAYVAPTARPGPVSLVVVKAFRLSIILMASADTKTETSNMEANGATAAASTANAVVASLSMALESVRLETVRSPSLHHLNSQAARPVPPLFQQRPLLAASVRTAHVVAKMDTNAEDTLAVSAAVATAFAATRQIIATPDANSTLESVPGNTCRRSDSLTSRKAGTYALRPRPKPLYKRACRQMDPAVEVRGLNAKEASEAAVARKGLWLRRRLLCSRMVRVLLTPAGCSTVPTRVSQKAFSSGCITTNIPSLDGACAALKGFTCMSGPFDGKCCSAASYCGDEDNHCRTCW